MSKLLCLMSLLPFGTYAQEIQPDSTKKTMKWEVGLNTAFAFGTTGNEVIYDDLFLVGRNSVSVYHNFSGSQIGLVIEGGLTGVGETWYLSPQVVVNYKIPFKKLYAYGGGAGGYIKEKSQYIPSAPDVSGLIMGAQAGAVYGLGKHFGLNVEAGVRFKHMYMSVASTTPGPAGDPIVVTQRGIYTDVYFPVSVGVRYRF